MKSPNHSLHRIVSQVTCMRVRRSRRRKDWEARLAISGFDGLVEEVRPLRSCSSRRFEIVHREGDMKTETENERMEW